MRSMKRLPKLENKILQVSQKLSQFSAVFPYFAIFKCPYHKPHEKFTFIRY